MAARARRRVSRGSLFFALTLALCLSVAVLAVGGYVALRSYLRSAEFRKLVEREAGRSLRVDLTLAPMTWTGSSVYAESATATGSPGAAVNSLAARDLRTAVDLRALLSRKVHLQPLEITSLQLGLEQPISSPQPTVTAVPKVQSWWKPKEIKLEEALVQQLSIKSLWFELIESRGDLKLGETMDLVLTGGRLQLPRFPPLRQEETRLRFMPQEVHVLQSRGGVGEKGQIEASGVIGLGADPSGDLQVKWRDVDLKLIFPEAWREVLQGHAAGAAHFTRADGSSRVAGKIRSADASIGLIPVLQLLRDFTGSERFAQVPLQELSADFSQENGLLTLTSIAVESNGLIRLEGNCSTDGQTVDGSFNVGVSPSVLRWIPGGYGKVFAENRGGFLWTSMKIDGPLSHPNEDLSARLVAAIPSEVIDQAVEGASKAGKVIQDGVGGVIDTILGF